MAIKRKKCSKCGRWLSLNSFYRRVRRDEPYLDSQCVYCHSDYQAERNAAFKKKHGCSPGWLRIKSDPVKLAAHRKVNAAYARVRWLEEKKKWDRAVAKNERACGMTATRRKFLEDQAKSEKRREYERKMAARAWRRAEHA